MLNRLGTWVVRYRLLVIVFWLLLLFPSLYGASRLHTLLQSEVASAPGTEMNRQEALLNQDFPQQNLYSIQLVLESASHTLDDPAFQALLAQYEEIVRAEPGAVEPVSPNQVAEQVGQDRKTAYIFIGLNGRNLAEADKAA